MLNMLSRRRRKINTKISDASDGATADEDGALNMDMHSDRLESELDYHSINAVQSTGVASCADATMEGLGVDSTRPTKRKRTV